MKIIDFKEITENGKNSYLSGKKKGLAARQHFGLDILDNSDEAIQVIIPDNIDCNISFLSGLFSKSVLNLKSRSAFLEKYQFVQIPEKIRDILNNVITGTLSKGTGLSGL